MKKRVLLPWSGGFDSTALLLKALKDETVNEINTVSFQLENNGKQSKAEKKSRIKIEKLLIEKYPIEVQKWTSKTTQVIPVIQINGYVGLTQPIIWATYLPLSLGQNIKYNHEIWLGYVRFDCFWHIKHEFEMIFKNACKITHKQGTIVYPLEWEYKEHIVKNYFNNNIDVYKATSSCEVDTVYTPKHWSKCSCDKCKTKRKLYNVLKTCNKIAEEDKGHVETCILEKQEQ